MTPLEYTVAPSVLQAVWLLLVAVLWIGYFFLEGFDYGVGMLLGFFTKDEKERRLLVNTIGPVWDGNEVWLVTGGGALFDIGSHILDLLYAISQSGRCVMMATHDYTHMKKLNARVVRCENGKLLEKTAEAAM